MLCGPPCTRHLDASDPTTNFGTLTQLRTDGSPIQRSYLRFTVSGITQTITSATLQVYANSSTSQSVTASQVSDNSWTETGITYNNAPAVGAAINSAGPVTSGTWLSIDVTPYILQNSTYSVVLTTNGSTGINFSSREDTAHPPQLILQFGNVATTFGACPERSRRVGTYWEVTLPNSNAVKYYYFGAQRVAMRGSSETVYYLHTDPLGSIGVTTDASQVVQGTRNYFPFGYIRVRSGDVKTNDACNQIDSRNQWGYNFDDWCINAG